MELCSEIKEFLLASKHAKCMHLGDNHWLLDLPFLTDPTNMLNRLNLELQSKDMISSVNADHDLPSFQNLLSELEKATESECAT